MNHLHAIIIDDEFNGIGALEALIHRFTPQVRVVATTSDPAEGIKLINSYRPDVVFLDINMPGLNGFDVLDRIHHRNFSLIFTTAHREYAISAIRRSASGYLLKPISPDELIFAVEHAKQRLNEDQALANVEKEISNILEFNNLRIPLPGKSLVEYVTPSMVIYMEAFSNSCKVVLVNYSEIEVFKSLKTYEQSLCKDYLGFKRVHKSYIVNMNYVTRYDKKDGGVLIMKDKKKIPISRVKRGEVLRFFNLTEEL